MIMRKESNDYSTLSAYNPNFAFHVDHLLVRNNIRDSAAMISKIVRLSVHHFEARNPQL